MAFCDTLMAQCFDALPVMLWVMNPKGGVIFYNRATYQYYGPGIAAALHGGQSGPLFHPHDAEAREAARRRALRTGLDVHVDLRAIRYDYMPRWHEMRLKPLFNKAPVIAGLLVTMTDIHDGREDASEPAPI